MNFYLNDLTVDDRDALHGIISNPRFYYPYINQNKRTPQDLFQAASDYVCMAENARCQVPEPHWFKAVRSLAEGAERHRLLGAVVLIDIGVVNGEKSAEIGFFIDVEHQGKGYGTRAAFEVVDWAQQAFGLQTLRATVDPDFTASQAVLKKIGLVQTGFKAAAETGYFDKHGNPRPRLVMQGDEATITGNVERFWDGSKTLQRGLRLFGNNRPPPGVY